MLLSGVAVIDCRAAVAFAQGHYAGSANFTGMVDLQDRMHELPDTSVALSLLGDESLLGDMTAWLMAKGYHVIASEVLTQAMMQSFMARGLWVKGDISARLWSPSRLVAQFVEEMMPLHGIRLGTGLDIGCGSGRDLVYLAMHGWDMTGFDIRPEMLVKAQQLASRQGLSIRTLARDLEQGGDPFKDYADASVDLICVARYLHRPLFPYFKRLLAPGGVIVYQTFMQGCEAFGSPKNPNFLLKQDELANIFSGYRLLLNEVVRLPDGRPVAAFVAQNGAY